MPAYIAVDVNDFVFVAGFKKKVSKVGPLTVFFGTPLISIQYCLRLSSTSQNPAYSAVFNSKFKHSFQRKPIHSYLQAVGFRRKDTLQCPTLPTPPWLLHHPDINFSLHSLHKDDTAPEIFRHNFNELYADYNHFTRLYTDGSKMGDGVASAVVWQKSCKTVRLPKNASIFRAELCNQPGT